MTTSNHDPLGPDTDELTPEAAAEADALEAILARSREAAQGQPSGDGTMDGLEAIVGRLRAAYEDDTGFGSAAATNADAFQAKRVAQRVLQRTTREDLRRRGDVGVLLDFAADRLRDSQILRIAAAVLVVQLTLVPLVAWQVWKAPHSGVFHTGIEPSAEELRKQLLDDLPAEENLDLVDEETLLGAFDTVMEQELQRMALDEAVKSSAASLRSMAEGLSVSAGAAPTSRLGAALLALTESASGEATSFDARLSAPGTGGLLETLLDVEARLVHLDGGGSWKGLPAALEQLVAGARGLTSDEGRTLLPLVVRALLHAEVAGLALPDETKALFGADVGLWQPGASAWLKALGAAAQAAPGTPDGVAGVTQPASDPFVDAWIAAIVQDS